MGRALFADSMSRARMARMNSVSPVMGPGLSRSRARSAIVTGWTADRAPRGEGEGGGGSVTNNTGLNHRPISGQVG